MIVIHNIARSIFVDKKGRKRKIMEEVREHCQMLKIYERNDLTFFTQVAIFGRINCK